jgi:hypothetical protein
MDASDRIRKLQAQAVFTFYKLNVLNPATCNTTTCGNLGPNCVVTYPNYDEKNKVIVGKGVCLECTGSCSC